MKTYNIITELSYDDISLYSREISEISSRFNDEINTKKNITIGTNSYKIEPIIASPMLDVCGLDMCKWMTDNNMMAGVYHRFNEKEQWKYEMNEIFNYVKGKVPVSLSMSLKNEKLDDLIEIWENQQIKSDLIICIDVANGSSKMIEKSVKELQKRLENTSINYKLMSGNIVTSEAAEYLYNLGISLVRISVGSGSVCRTPLETGVFRPIISAIDEIHEMKEKRNYNDLYLIADGGIRSTADIMKSFAVGADFIMCGQLLAGWSVSNGEIIELDEKMYKKYRGSASLEIAKINRSLNNNENKSIMSEGISSLIEYKGDNNILNDFWFQLNGGIRSAMSYCNSKNLVEFYNKVQIVRCTESSNRIRETHVRSK